MDSRDMTDKPEEIRRVIEDTRASLTDKLCKLENQVRGTVEDARGVVEDGIDHIKEKVSLSHHVNERPWSFFAGSVVLGLAVGVALTRSTRHQSPQVYAMSSSSNGHSSNGDHSLAERLWPMFETEAKMLKGAAVSGLIALMSNVTKGTLQPALTEFVDGAVAKYLRSPVPAGARGR